MVRLIEAMNYRSLKRVRQPLDAFHVLVGPNASGKSTFMDVLAFLSRLVTDGLDKAIADRGTFEDLCWGREGERFELAIEVVLPEHDRKALHLFSGEKPYAVRYEIAVGKDSAGTVKIVEEQVLLASGEATYMLALQAPADPSTVFTPESSGSWTRLVSRGKSGSEYTLSPEVYDPARNNEDPYWVVYRPTGKRPIFGGISETEFPTTIALELLLRDQIARVDVQPEVLRQASASGQGERFIPNGANLPWLVEELQRHNPRQFGDWITHVHSALPSVEGVRVVERPEERKRYLMVKYAGGLEVPSWCCSDGTLCLLALTFLAYYSSPGDVYLVEEPEAHIHPLNVEPVMQSLSSVYGGQVFVSTHSPAVLAMTDVSQVLTFSSNSETGTRILPGKEHPRLREWKGEVSLGTLFASGVLG